MNSDPKQVEEARNEADVKKLLAEMENQIHKLKLENKRLHDELDEMRKQLGKGVKVVKVSGEEPPSDPVELAKNLNLDLQKILSFLVVATSFNDALTMQMIHEKLEGKKSLGRISDHLADLEKRGYVIRIKGESGTFRWIITDKGREVLEAFDKAERILFPKQSSKNLEK